MKKKWLRRNALTLLILVAFGAAAVWTTMTFNRMPDPPVVKAVTLEAVTDYEITSANELTAYPAGTVFPKNLAAYFYAAGPGVVLYPRVTVSGLDKGELEGTIDYQAELMAADERLGTYWSYGLEAIPPESFRLTPDTRAFTSKGMPLEVQSYYDLALMIREEIDSNAGNIQLRLSATIRVEGTANAVPVKRQTVQTFDLTLRDNSFSVTLPPEENISKITAVPASVPPAFADRLLTFAADNLYLLVLDGVLLLALVLSLVLRDRRASKAEAERKRFKEWISEGTVEVKGKTPIQIVSLEGLVDLAIDLDKRVIYDDAAKRYFVLEEDLLYSHDPLAADGHLEKKPQLGKLLLEKGYIRQEELETGLY
jgi:hypothetical protein